MNKRQTMVALLMAGMLGGNLAAWAGEAAPAGQVLWYERPAASWGRETLPLGNGRLGAMVFGGMKKERIQFNEDSLWVGDELDTGAYQAFGDLFIDFSHANGTGYRRALDLARAVWHRESKVKVEGGDAYSRSKPC